MLYLRQKVFFGAIAFALLFSMVGALLSVPGAEATHQPNHPTPTAPPAECYNGGTPQGPREYSGVWYYCNTNNPGGAYLMVWENRVSIYAVHYSTGTDGAREQKFKFILNNMSDDQYDHNSTGESCANDFVNTSANRDTLEITDAEEPNGVELHSGDPCGIHEFRDMQFNSPERANYTHRYLDEANLRGTGRLQRGAIQGSARWARSPDDPNKFFNTEDPDNCKDTLQRTSEVGGDNGVDEGTVSVFNASSGNCDTPAFTYKARIENVEGSKSKAAGTGEDPGDEDASDSQCKGTGGIAKVFNWILCPLAHTISEFAQTMITQWLTPFLQVDPLNTRSSEDPSEESGIFGIWKFMRNVANALLIVVFFLVIFSQAVQVGLDNYQIKRMLPRLLLAVVGIQLSFYIMGIMVDIFNVLGNGIYDLIIAPIRDVEPHQETEATGIAGIVSTAAIFTGLIGLGTALVFNWAGVVIFLVGAVIALLGAAITLVLRQVIVVGLIVISPLAILGSILPNTQSLYQRWSSLFFKMLLMFPMVVGLFAMGRLVGSLALISSGGGWGRDTFATLIYVGASIVPILMIPATFKFAGASMVALGAVFSRLSGRARESIDKSQSGLWQWTKNRDQARREIRQREVATRAGGGTSSRTSRLLQRGLEGTPKSQWSAAQRARSRTARILDAGRKARSGGGYQAPGPLKGGKAQAAGRISAATVNAQAQEIANKHLPYLSKKDVTSERAASYYSSLTAEDAAQSSALKDEVRRAEDSGNHALARDLRGGDGATIAALEANYRAQAGAASGSERTRLTNLANALQRGNLNGRATGPVSDVVRNARNDAEAQRRLGNTDLAQAIDRQADEAAGVEDYEGGVVGLKWAADYSQQRQQDSRFIPDANFRRELGQVLSLQVPGIRAEEAGHRTDVATHHANAEAAMQRGDVVTSNEESRLAAESATRQAATQKRADDMMARISDLNSNGTDEVEASQRHQQDASMASSTLVNGKALFTSQTGREAVALSLAQGGYLRGPQYNELLKAYQVYNPDGSINDEQMQRFMQLKNSLDWNNRGNGNMGYAFTNLRRGRNGQYHVEQDFDRIKDFLKQADIGRVVSEKDHSPSPYTGADGETVRPEGILQMFSEMAAQSQRYNTELGTRIRAAARTRAEADAENRLVEMEREQNNPRIQSILTGNGWDPATKQWEPGQRQRMLEELTQENMPRWMSDEGIRQSATNNLQAGWTPKQHDDLRQAQAVEDLASRLLGQYSSAGSELQSLLRQRGFSEEGTRAGTLGARMAQGDRQVVAELQNLAQLLTKQAGAVPPAPPTPTPTTPVPTPTPTPGPAPGGPGGPRIVVAPAPIGSTPRPPDPERDRLRRENIRPVVGTPAAPSTTTTNVTNVTNVRGGGIAPDNVVDLGAERARRRPAPTTNYTPPTAPTQPRPLRPGEEVRPDNDQNPAA